MNKLFGILLSAIQLLTGILAAIVFVQRLSNSASWASLIYALVMSVFAFALGIRHVIEMKNTK